MQEISERLKEIIAFYQINAGEFAQKLGVQKSSISHLLSGRNKPSFSFINKLIKAFPDLNIKWFLTGEGKMIVETPEVPSPSQEKIENKTASSTENTKKNEQLKLALEIQSNELAPQSKTDGKQENAKKTNSEKVQANSKNINQIIMIYADDTFKILTKNN